MTLPKRPLKPLPKTLPPLALDPSPMPPLPAMKWYLEGPWYGKRSWACLRDGIPDRTLFLSTALPFDEQWEAESFKCRASFYNGFVAVQRGAE